MPLPVIIPAPGNPLTVSNLAPALKFAIVVYVLVAMGGVGD